MAGLTLLTNERSPPINIFVFLIMYPTSRRMWRLSILRCSEFYFTLCITTSVCAETVVHDDFHNKQTKNSHVANRTLVTSLAFKVLFILIGVLHDEVQK